jgi:hypothetical protein
MLAKSWKKIALAICIIAILFNITSKLVHRTSVKEELTTVLGGDAIVFLPDEEDETNEVNTETK